MFSKTAARSKSYFLRLPAAAMVMGHSTVVQPFRRMRTKVRKTTAKFRRHTPLAPAIEDDAHNTAGLPPVLAPLSPLEIETWYQRSPSPPPPSSPASTSSLQNHSDSDADAGSQRQDTEDFDAGSTSQLSGNPLWAQRFQPGLRIPSGSDMNNNAGAQSLSPISPLPSPVSPSPLYPSNMISPMSFYSQDSIPHNDHFYSSTIDTTISLTTPITDIFTNTTENETDEDFTPYGYEFTNTQMFGGSEPIDHATDEYTNEGNEGQTNNGSITRPFEFKTNNIQRFSGSEVIEYTIEGQYGTRLKELPAPRIHGMQDIDVLELGPPANAPTIVELPAETSLHHILSGQDFSVTINGPTRAESAFDDQAIDNIHRDIVNAPHQLARINIVVSKGTEELAYAGGLINDIFYVLQGCKLTPDQISVYLPMPAGQLQQDSRIQPLLMSNVKAEAITGDVNLMIGNGTSHAMLQQMKNIPPLVPWWSQGRMDVSQLSRLTISYPLPLDTFVEVLSQCPNLEEVAVEWILPALSDSWFNSTKLARLDGLFSLSMRSEVDLYEFFNCVAVPGIRDIKLGINAAANPHTYDIHWEGLASVEKGNIITAGF
ncbi:hypothetical protein PLEOSDRAFT_1107858 [Pleurotus ostreatus PC15]|uniref:Uncharacterized protein n=1 Tax=Pleurotus ostreatus (strain PC15) TaxID=1137138 RepID=A0A067NDA4_PLEO1|nr:hypothetical protein PLEOSDRAFT_1107858 [Pleurotus ostreatus PC15]